MEDNWQDPKPLPIKKWTVDDYEYQSHELIHLNNIVFGTKLYSEEENTWQPFFTIGNQTFSLEAVDRDSAEWYIEVLKAALFKLTR